MNSEPRRNAFLLSELRDFVEAAVIAVQDMPDCEYKRGYYQALRMIAAMTGIDHDETQHRYADGTTTIQIRQPE